RGGGAGGPGGRGGGGGRGRRPPAVASGILRDAAAAGASKSSPARRARSWLAADPASGDQAATPWNEPNAPVTPAAVAPAQSLRQLVGDVLRLAPGPPRRPGAGHALRFRPGVQSP